MTWSADDIERYRNALLLLARALLARQRAADFEASDLVQNTLLEAHRDRDHFRGQSEQELFAWLRKMLHNNLLDEMEKRRAQRRDVGRQVLEADLTASFVGLDELLIGAHTTPSQRLLHNELLARLAEALQQLPEHQREAVLLKDLAGWTLEQIGERLGCTVAATAGLFVVLGMVVPLINGAVYAMLQGDFVEPLVWLCMFSMYPALFAVFLLAPKSRSDLDSHATRKELWAIWGGKLFTAITIAIVLRCAFDIKAREAVLLCYAIFASLSGMAVFIMVRDFARPLYLLAVSGWLVSLLMLLRLEWAPLIYGLYGGLGCVLFGIYERRLGRELR